MEPPKLISSSEGLLPTEIQAAMDSIAYDYEYDSERQGACGGSALAGSAPRAASRALGRPAPPPAPRRPRSPACSAACSPASSSRSRPRSALVLTAALMVGIDPRSPSSSASTATATSGPGPAASTTPPGRWSRRCCSPGRSSASPALLGLSTPRRWSRSSPPSPTAGADTVARALARGSRPPQRAAAPAHGDRRLRPGRRPPRRPPRAPLRVRPRDDRHRRRRRPHPQRRPAPAEARLARPARHRSSTSATSTA